MLLFLNDTPVYAAVFFGAVRVGFVPILINTFSPRDLIRFYLEDAAAKVAVVDAEYAALFDAAVVHTKLHTLIAVNGTAPDRNRGHGARRRPLVRGVPREARVCTHCTR